MKSALHNRKSATAFTLVELLVVITLIVVLLALLTPALDRAVYQAELVVCSARLHALGTSVTHYAMDHQRRYPARAVSDSAGGSQRRPTEIKVHMEYDERPILKGFLQINAMLNCPLTQRMDYEENIDPESSINVPYGLW
jgi:competence protein ComGC